MKVKKLWVESVTRHRWQRTRQHRLTLTQQYQVVQNEVVVARVRHSQLLLSMFAHSAHPCPALGWGMMVLHSVRATL